MIVPRVAVTLALLVGMGCDGSLRDPSVPPFRIRPYGPGLEVNSEGRKYEFWDGDELVGKVRVSSNGIRVYDSVARLVGRLSPIVDGWRLLRADGSRLCSVTRLEGEARLVCETGTLMLGGEADRLVVLLDGEPWLRLVEGAGWRTETPGEPEAFGRWSDGASLSIQTRSDAWSHTEIRPAWQPASAIAWSLDFPGIEPADDRLIGGTLAYLVADRLAGLAAASPEPSTPPGEEEGSGQSSSDSASSDGP